MNIAQPSQPILPIHAMIMYHINQDAHLANKHINVQISSIIISFSFNMIYITGLSSQEYLSDQDQ